MVTNGISDVKALKIDNSGCGDALAQNSLPRERRNGLRVHNLNPSQLVLIEQRLVATHEIDTLVIQEGRHSWRMEARQARCTYRFNDRDMSWNTVSAFRSQLR